MCDITWVLADSSHIADVMVSMLASCVDITWVLAHSSHIAGVMVSMLVLCVV